MPECQRATSPPGTGPRGHGGEGQGTGLAGENSPGARDEGKVSRMLCWALPAASNRESREPNSAARPSQNCCCLVLLPYAWEVSGTGRHFPSMSQCPITPPLGKRYPRDAHLISEVNSYLLEANPNDPFPDFPAGSPPLNLCPRH